MTSFDIYINASSFKRMKNCIFSNVVNEEQFKNKPLSKNSFSYYVRIFIKNFA